MPIDGTRAEDLLEQVLRVLCATLVADKPLVDGAQTLGRLGVSRTVIAKVYATSENSVSATLSKVRKAAGTTEQAGASKKSERPKAGEKK